MVRKPAIALGWFIGLLACSASAQTTQGLAAPPTRPLTPIEDAEVRAKWNADVRDAAKLRAQQACRGLGVAIRLVELDDRGATLVVPGRAVYLRQIKEDYAVACLGLVKP